MVNLKCRKESEERGREEQQSVDDDTALRVLGQRYISLGRNVGKNIGEQAA